MVFAVEWVKLNPSVDVEGAPYAAKHSLAANEEESLWDELAEQGCLHVDDVSIPAFADGAGISEYAARKLIRESLMLVCLLPREWAQVLRGGVEIWRARLLAADCWELSPEAVAFVDQHMSQVTVRLTLNGREAITAEAKRRLMPEVVAAEARFCLSQCAALSATLERQGPAAAAGADVYPSQLHRRHRPRDARQCAIRNESASHEPAWEYARRGPSGKLEPFSGVAS